MLMIETYQIYCLAASIIVSAIIGSVAYLVSVLIRENSLNQRTLTKMNPEGGGHTSGGFEDKIFEMILGMVVSNPTIISSLFSTISGVRSGIAGQKCVTPSKVSLPPTSKGGASQPSDLAPGFYRDESGQIKMKADYNVS